MKIATFTNKLKIINYMSLLFLLIYLKYLLEYINFAERNIHILLMKVLVNYFLKVGINFWNNDSDIYKQNNPIFYHTFLI